MSVFDELLKWANTSSNKELPSLVKSVKDLEGGQDQKVFKVTNFSPLSPYFIDLIEDNDTGTWKLPNIKDFVSGFNVNYDLKLNYDNINKFKYLFKKNTIDKLIRTGKIYNQYKNFLVNENSTRISLEKFPSQKIYKEFNNFFNKNVARLQINIDKDNTNYIFGRKIKITFNERIQYILLDTLYIYPHNWYYIYNHEYLKDKIINSIICLNNFIDSYKNLFNINIPLLFINKIDEKTKDCIEKFINEINYNNSKFILKLYLLYRLFYIRYSLIIIIIINNNIIYCLCIW